MTPPKRSTQPPKKRSTPRALGDLASLAFIFGLVFAVYLLPADTSLSQIRERGRLTVCMPERFPPLVTGDPAAPGFDVEMLRMVASRLGVNLSVSGNSAIGRDFNPRNWRVTRAQCDMLAGGVVLSLDVRSFLDTLPSPLTTGWAIVSREGLTTLAGAEFGVFPGLTGLDRIGLSRYLRQAGAEVRIAQSAEALAEGLRSGTWDGGITEALSARQLAEREGWTARWLPQPVERYRLGYGFWRGDLTLLQAVEGILAALEREGLVAALLDKYDIAPLVEDIGRR